MVSQSNVFSFQATITNQNVINLDQLDYFLKQNMSQSSILQQDNWTLTSLQPLDDATINQSDINYLVENKDSLIRIIE